MDDLWGSGRQTRRDMQQLLLRIWDETASTVLFVTHDVEEGIYLGTGSLFLAPAGTIVEDILFPFGSAERP